MDVTCAAIIAGGASRRMGHTKALIDVEGQPLIARVAEVLRRVFLTIVVVTPSPEIADAAKAPAIADIYAGKGPLAGVHAALQYTGQPTFCVACDMPSLNADFIRYMRTQHMDNDIVVPRLGAYDEPLHAIYTPACLPVIEHELQRDHVGPVDNIYRHLKVRFVDADEARRFDAELRMFENWNTPEEVKKSLANE